MEGEGYLIEGVGFTDSARNDYLGCLGEPSQKDQFKEGAWNTGLVIFSIYIALFLSFILYT